MTVKANMPTLYRQLKKLPWAAVPSVSAVRTDHGRRARRTIKAALAPAWIEFDGAAQVALLRLDGHINIAAANRHHARDPQRTLKLLQTA